MTGCNIFVLISLQFYFGDKNLPKDKFLRQKADEDEGCILNCLHFNELSLTKINRHHFISLTKVFQCSNV